MQNMKLQKVRAWTVLQHSKSADISQWVSTPFCNRPAAGQESGPAPAAALAQADIRKPSHFQNWQRRIKARQNAAMV
jgi:hypothetical protein